MAASSSPPPDPAGRSADGSPAVDAAFVKSLSQNYDVDEVHRLLRDIYCSTVQALNLEVIQLWLQVVRDIGDFLRSQSEQAYLQSHLEAMHLRLTTCWNEILYAIVGHVRHAPNLLGQTFQRSAASKRVAVNGCIACFCRFCSQVGLTWNKGVSDVLSLLRSLLAVLQEHQQDTAQVDAWIRRSEESQANISAACSEFQKTFKVLTSLVDEGNKEVPSEVGLMQKLLSVCGDLKSEVATHVQDDVLMAERLVASDAVYRAKTAMLEAWVETVSFLLTSFVRTWQCDLSTASTDSYVAPLQGYHGCWARILASAMVSTDLVESEVIRGELQPAAVKAARDSLLSHLRRETDSLQTLRPQPPGRLAAFARDAWQRVSGAVESGAASLGRLLDCQPPYEGGPADQSGLSRFYLEATGCLERYEQMVSLMRHVALYESNTVNYGDRLARACEHLRLSLGASPELRQLRQLNGIRDDLTVLQGDLLVWLKDKRKDRQIPDSFPLLFQSTLTGWMLDFERAIGEIREELQSPQEKRDNLDSLLKSLEEGYGSVTAITHEAFLPETWQVGDISILANISQSLADI